MRSKRPSDLLDLDENLQTGEEDVRALRRSAAPAYLDFGEYLEQLTDSTRLFAATRRTKFRGEEDFEL